MKERLQALRDAKLTLGTALLILAGLVAIAHITLGVSLLRSRDERDALSAQIALGEEVLATAQDVRDELVRLPDDLDAARDELSRAEAAFPTELDVNDFLEAVLDRSEEAGVRVQALQLLTNESEDEELEDDDRAAYASLAVVLRVEGSYGRLIELLRLLEERAGATTVASYAVQGGDNGLSMELELRTFARPDDPALSDVEPAPEASP